MHHSLTTFNIIIACFLQTLVYSATLDTLSLSRSLFSLPPLCQNQCLLINSTGSQCAPAFANALLAAPDFTNLKPSVFQPFFQCLCPTIVYSQPCSTCIFNASTLAYASTWKLMNDSCARNSTLDAALLFLSLGDPSTSNISLNGTVTALVGNGMTSGFAVLALEWSGGFFLGSLLVFLL